MKKLTFSEVEKIIYKHNEENNIKQQYQDNKALEFVMVFKNESFKQSYPLKSRSYSFRSDNKLFLPSMCGTSLYGSCLDGSENIRLDWYIGEWKIDYCYQLEG